MAAESDQAKRIFLEAIEFAEPRLRSEFLDRTCLADPQLRLRVDALLRAFDDPGTFLAQPLLDPIDMVPLTQPTSTMADSSRFSVASHPSPASQATQGADAAPHEVLPPTPSLDFLEPCEKPNRIGKLGAYEIIDLIGCGGMGIVFRAYDTKLHRVVAIKVLAPHLSLHATATRRFLREAQAAAAVSHERVVTIFAVEESSTPPYLVMECIQGQSLQEKIDRCGALGTREILRIGMQIADGLAAAHQQGLVHRDIKPSNILLENGVERVKITDFGLARAVDDIGMTQTGHIAGTPQYMSPEQATGGDLDARSDLFSLGSVLYTMCTGRPAFRAESSVAVLRRVCDDEPRPIREINPEIPEWLAELIAKLLAKRPENRFQSTAEVADLLGQYLAWLQQSSVGRTPRPMPSILRVSSLPPTRDRRSNPWLVVPAILLTVFTVVVAVSFLPRLRSWSDLPSLLARSRSTSPSEVGPGGSDSGSSSSSATYIDLAGSNPELPLGGPYSLRADVPFRPEEARRLQESWATYLDVPVEITDDLGLTFRLIPPGSFGMGYSPEELSERLLELEYLGADDFTRFNIQASGPRHRVELSRPYYLSQFEITGVQFQKFVESTNYVSTLESAESPPFTWRNWFSEEASPKLPVWGISWEDARAFCRWRTVETGRTHSLPTEAQWEFACRAGSDSLWSFGSDPSLLERHAVFGAKGGSGPSEVGTREPNPFGIFDLHGNVDEWCLDWHMRDYYLRSPKVDPVLIEKPSDANSGRVARGGSWNADALWSHAATRTYDFPEKTVLPKGFRVAIVDVPSHPNQIPHQPLP